MYDEALHQERQSIFEDVYNGRIPKRVPISAWITVDFAIQYSGMDVFEAQWHPDRMEAAFRKVAEEFYADTLPVHDAIRFPAMYEILGAKNFIMGSNGYLQHPEITPMKAEEYGELAKDPIGFIVETLLPRIYSELDTTPEKRSIVMAKAYKAHCDTVGYMNGVLLPKLEKEYGFYQGPEGSGGMTAVPLDYIADQMRGFKEFSSDVRRHKKDILKANAALLPIMLNKGIPPAPSRNNYTFMPLHMPPYMRTKDVEELYLPDLKRIVEEIDAAGGKASLFLEHDWMRFLDHLSEFPENTVYRFEFGDAQKIKDKLGDKFIICGLYPVGLLKTGTEQECIDEAKRLFDILAPGGGYIFDFDKNIITTDSVNVDNLKAVLNFVREYGKY